MSYKEVNPKISFPDLEENILKHWNENKTFEKSVENRSKAKTFSFYDGPPFATGTPHYGHLLAGTIKDVIPRFKTMQGYRVERIWGWDTHGLPIENIVEKELDLKSKLQVEEYGIDKFNEQCRSKVLEYAEEWKKIVGRTGRWIDMDNAYLTMSPEFMESVWWVFKSLFDKGLIYEGHKVMPYCPRCATPLSNFEVGLGYQDKNDKAITVKFQSTDDENTYYLAWTTTPWTLPGNLALSVGPKISYVKVEKDGKYYVLAKDLLQRYETELGDNVVEEFTGKDLVGKTYKPILNCYKEHKKAFVIIDGEHVSTTDGTGIVHTAPAFGEEDFLVAKRHGIDFYMPVDDLGNFTVEVSDFAGESVIEPDTNNKIIDTLKDQILKVESITHSYPHCWRCKTPLIYKGVSSWFVAVEKIKADAYKNNQDIYWLPDNIGHGRFAKLIEGAPDWSISRNRFWGTPLPVWKCNKCNKIEVIGSISELENKTRLKHADIHLHKMSDAKFGCDCGGVYEITGEVLDCWFESGSMPYASIHYPFENNDKFERDFPADFIAEGIDQTRGWFYSLLMLSTALYGKSSFKNVIVNGTVLAEDGQKMSKSLRNYPDPMDVVHKYGADAMRFYIMSSPAVKAEDFRFSEKGVDETIKKINLTLWNSYGFFVTYASIDKFKPTGKLELSNQLDFWAVSAFNQLVLQVTESLEKYDLSKAARLLAEFLDDLSNWYIRRSRRRFWKSENDNDKNAAYETLHYVLKNYVKLLAPFMPFVAEEIYLNISDENVESVHLADWPKADESLISTEVNEQIKLARSIVEKGLKIRARSKINVRQPLGKAVVYDVLERELTGDVILAIKEELNVLDVQFAGLKGVKQEINVNFKTVGPKLGNKVKEVSSALRSGDYKLDDDVYLVLGETLNQDDVQVRLMLDDASESEGDGQVAVSLDTKITEDLYSTGLARELVRKIQDARKQAGYKVDDRILVYLDTKNIKITDIVKLNISYIMAETLALEIVFDKKSDTDYNETVSLDNNELWFGICKVNE
jgi:isoleucyl-tRNA synthetase